MTTPRRFALRSAALSGAFAIALLASLAVSGAGQTPGETSPGETPGETSQTETAGPASPAKPSTEPFTEDPWPAPLPVRWTADIGSGATAPVLAAGDRLYVATSRKDVKAFAAGTGRELWSTDLAKGFQAPPALAGNVLVVGAPFPERKTYGLDPATGETLWERETGDVTQAPLVGDGRVIVVSIGGTIRALNPASGEILWETRVEGVFPGGAVLLEGNLVVLSALGVLHRLDPATGDHLGSLALGGSAAHGLPVLSDGSGFLAATHAGRARGFAPDLTPLAIDFSAGPLLYAPAAGAGRLVVAGADRVVRAHALPGGERLWERALPVAFTGPSALSPDGGVAAVGDLAGAVWTLDATTGEVLSRTPLEGTAALPAWTSAGLAVVTERGPLALLDAAALGASPQ